MSTMQVFLGVYAVTPSVFMITWNVAGPVGTIVPGVPVFGIVPGQQYNYYRLNVGTNPGPQFTIQLSSNSGDADLCVRSDACPD